VDRRAFVVGGVGALAGSVGAKSARADRIPRVGILGGGPSPSWEAFRRGLRERGYVEGRTIVLEYRWHGGNVDRSAALVAELAQRKVDVIVATSVPVIRAAQQAAPTIPIVMAASFDAVESGLVVTLARPGGNTTGLSLRSGDVVGKRLELLREALRDMPRLAVLLGPPAPADPILLKALETVAKPMRVRLQLVRYPGGTQLEDAFFAMVRERATAVLVSEHPIFAFAERGRLAELAAKHRLPTMVSFREFVEAGALMSYAADLADLADRAAGYVDRILKGARPAELPVEEPIKFLFVINLKTAKALGLTIPPSLLARADQVIE
jgi:ABC-type uncharacterized transport system substrate-binding protein